MLISELTAQIREPLSMKLRTRHGTPRASGDCDPEGLLQSYWLELADLYDEFGSAIGDGARRRIAERICHAVAAQCDVEEELLYPAATRLSNRPDNRIRAAQLEGAFVRKIAEQIRSLSQDDHRLAGTLDVLKAYISDYLEQQRADVLPRLVRKDPQISGLFQAMQHRRAQILGDAR
jgi:hypothetical protein